MTLINRTSSQLTPDKRSAQQGTNRTIRQAEHTEGRLTELTRSATLTKIESRHMRSILDLGDCNFHGCVALPAVACCIGVSPLAVNGVTEFVGTMFSELSVLVTEDVEDAGEVICVRPGTRDAAVACPACGTERPVCTSTGSGRTAEVAESWLRDHQGVEVVCCELARNSMVPLFVRVSQLARRSEAEPHWYCGRLRRPLVRPSSSRVHRYRTPRSGNNNRRSPGRGGSPGSRRHHRYGPRPTRRESSRCHLPFCRAHESSGLASTFSYKNES
jgi:hypothetical protein